MLFSELVAFMLLGIRCVAPVLAACSPFGTASMNEKTSANCLKPPQSASTPDAEK